MEERYMNMHRRQPDYRDKPPRRRTGTKQPPPSRKPAKHKRSGAASVAMGFYKALVVVSALIVAVYIGFSLMVKAPEQKPFPQPSQNGGQNAMNPGIGSGNTGTAKPDDPMALNRRDGVYTILLAATDKDGTRTDTMMVMCYDTVKQTVGVVSIPRDTLIDRGSGHHPKLVYGKGGVEQRVEDISQMLGIPIDGYVKVNIKGFITLVDYLGGIDFYVPCNMNYDDPYQNLSIHYKEGQRKLSGQQAMEVARFRKNNDGSGYSDVGRTETQQKLLVALAKKVLSWDSLTKVNGFVEIFNKNVSTDLTLDNMMYFAGQAINLDPSSAVETATLPGRGDGVFRGYTWCFELDPEGTLEMVNRLINPYDRDLTLKDMNLTKATSYTQG
ncbi:LCP family protein [Oscillospiraceae bacterium 50-58]